MDVLHYLDVAIGFSLSMMVLATLVGTTTAMWLSVIRSRTNNLQAGLELIIGTLGPDLPTKDLAASLLRDKMVLSWLPRRFSKTEAIGREEFVLMLLRNANGAGPWSEVSKVIQTITNQSPADLVKSVELAILAEEAADPSAPANVWRTKALAKTAPDLAARLFAQFDDVMTRTDDNTAYSTKVASTALALVFLVIYPVNSLDMITRLATEKTVATVLANEAEKTKDNTQLLNAVKQQAIFADTFDQPNKFWSEIYQTCGDSRLCHLTTAPQKALSQPGVLVTWVLLGMGAPFWQGLLDKLLGLRSKITAKTEDERAQRAAQS